MIDIPSLSNGYHRLTKEECIEDLLTVATEFPGIPLSRDFFREHSSIRERDWKSYFGKFPEFLKAAGIIDVRYQAKVLTKTPPRNVTGFPDVSTIKEVGPKNQSILDSYIMPNGRPIGDWTKLECEQAIGHQRLLVFLLENRLDNIKRKR